MTRCIRVQNINYPVHNSAIRKVGKNFFLDPIFHTRAQMEAPISSRTRNRTKKEDKLKRLKKRSDVNLDSDSFDIDAELSLSETERPKHQRSKKLKISDSEDSYWKDEDDSKSFIESDDDGNNNHIVIKNCSLKQLLEMEEQDDKLARIENGKEEVEFEAPAKRSVPSPPILFTPHPLPQELFAFPRILEEYKETDEEIFREFREVYICESFTDHKRRCGAPREPNGESSNITFDYTSR